MAFLINTDDMVTEIGPGGGRSTFTLEELQKLVGGYIEIVSLANGDLLVVNEDGMALGLPTNERATMIAERDRVRMGPGGILGDVVRCKRKEID